MTDRMDVLTSLSTRATCPSCGKWNKCALEEGRSITSCWCSAEKVIDKGVAECCLCRTCFKEAENA